MKQSSNTDDHFALFYQEQVDRVYNFFRYRFGDNTLAEDLTSITFEKAWKKRFRYDHNLAAFSTWIFTIARRTAIDQYRRVKAEIPIEEMDHLTSEETLEESIQKREDLARLSKLLTRFSNREKELVALKYGAGLTNREIAKLSRLSESNVGVILFRIIQTLRKEWEVPHE